MYFHSAHLRAHQVFDDDGILIALVLQEQRVLRLVYEFCDFVASVPFAPDKVRVFARVEGLPAPVRLEAVDNLADLAFVVRDHGIIPVSVRFLVSQLSDFTKAMRSSTTIDFSCVRSNTGLLSITSTPA